jgi:hypothetical protein
VQIPAEDGESDYSIHINMILRDANQAVMRDTDQVILRDTDQVILRNTDQIIVGKDEIS